MDWNAHLTELAMLKDTRERLDGIVKALLDAGNCFAIETSLPAEPGDDHEGEWRIWTTENGAKVLMQLAMDSPPKDHGSDRYDYVEVEAPPGVEPAGDWWEALVAQPCADCRANLFAKWANSHHPRTDRRAWHISVAHDNGCPRLEAEQR